VDILGGRIYGGGKSVKEYKNTTIHIKDTFPLTDDTYIMTIREEIEFSPGQFLMIETPYRSTRKPFILGFFGEDIAISVHVKGEGTSWIVRQRALKAHFPLGRAFMPPPGRGITIVSPASFTFGCVMFRIFASDVLVGTRKPLKTPVPFPSALGDEDFKKAIEDIKGGYDYYVVNGSRGMERFVYSEIGENVWVSMEEYMACGIGACKGCAIKTAGGIRHVCIDGPLFRGDEIIWEG